MDRTETLRREIQANKSALGKHSLNQGGARRQFEGERRLRGSRKQQLAQEERTRVDRRIDWQIGQGLERLENDEPLTREYREFLTKHGVI